MRKPHGGHFAACGTHRFLTFILISNKATKRAIPICVFVVIHAPMKTLALTIWA